MEIPGCNRGPSDRDEHAGCTQPRTGCRTGHVLCTGFSAFLWHCALGVSDGPKSIVPSHEFLLYRRGLLFFSSAVCLPGGRTSTPCQLYDRGRCFAVTGVRIYLCVCRENAVALGDRRAVRLHGAVQL